MRYSTGTKICNMCKIEKALDNFYRCSSNKDGFQGHCKTCRNIYQKRWNKNNRDKVNRYKRHRNKERRKSDIHFKIRDNTSRLVNRKLFSRGLSKNGKSIISILPYSIDELIKHLEGKFEPWMNWSNYGKKPGCWTIDHVKPDSKFNYRSTKDKEFQDCWALRNLQPLEFIANCKKGNKV